MEDTSAQICKALTASLGDKIGDLDEEVFSLFIETGPSQGLGCIDSTSAQIIVDVNGRELEILQSPGLLNGTRKKGTTGAVLWKVTPAMARWLVTPSSLLWSLGILHSKASIVELGCGIAGLLGICLAPMVDSYLLTDQEYVMKLVRENIATNTDVMARKGAGGRHSARVNHAVKSPKHMILDWETDSGSNIENVVGKGKAVDLLVACDCIYNNFLIRPFVDVCVDICKLSKSGRNTVVLVAQQLRTEDVLSEWLETAMMSFNIWRIPKQHLPTDLRTGSRYAVHLAVLKTYQP